MFYPITSQTHVVLGIDPGVAIVGYSFVSGTRQKPIIHDYGIITTTHTEQNRAHYRFAEIISDLQQLIDNYKPVRAVMEDLFFFKNKTTAMNVAGARGAIMALIGTYGIPLLSPTPLQIKQTLCGHGKAGKKEIQRMIKKIYNLDKIPKPDDAADSLAIAWWGL